MKYIITCRFCGIKTGELSFNDALIRKGKVKPTPPTVEDARCSACEALHGKFKDMETEYYQKGGKDYSEFKTMMEKAGFKYKDFKKELQKLGK